MTNLVAVDAQKVFEVALNAHLLWSCPLQVRNEVPQNVSMGGLSTAHRDNGLWGRKHRPLIIVTLSMDLTVPNRNPVMYLFYNPL